MPTMKERYTGRQRRDDVQTLLSAPEVVNAKTVAPAEMAAIETARERLGILNGAEVLGTVLELHRGGRLR